MSTQNVKLWRYVIPAEMVEGWAVVHMDSKGFFATCSDYGNYAYHWSNWGQRDFREFVLQLADDPSYLGNKLDHEKWHQHSDEKTQKHIREIIERERQDGGGLTPDRAEEELELLALYENGDIDFRQWIEQQHLFDDWSDASDCSVKEPSADIYAFCTKTMPKLAALLRAELQQEAAGSSGESGGNGNG